MTVAEIDAAIKQIVETEQSFSLDGVSYSRADLSTLIRLRDELAIESGRATGKRPVFRGFGFRGMGYDA